eukprot:GILJ01013564.1.p1 GENE.GILJ01013564.1~~GILJ01013564.1.p1  ORF type:complete len:317 (+),score=30.27 GILJ01013564.1:25-951(+)
MARLRPLLICVFYGTMSIFVTFVYKSISAGYAFKYPAALLFGQLVCSVLCCSILKAFRVIDYPDLSTAMLQKTFTVSILFVFNVFVGFVGLRLVNIPMFIALRKTVTIFVLAFEFYLLGKRVRYDTVQAIGLIVLGAIMAAASDMTSDILGYFFVILNNIATAAYLTATNKLSKATGLNSFGLLFYNGVNALPMTLLLSILLDEPTGIATYPYLYDPQFICLVLLASMTGVVLQYAIFLCSTVNSPLATSITGNLKDIFSSILGFLISSDVQPTLMLVMGIFTSLSGAGYYSYLKFMEQQNALPHGKN